MVEIYFGNINASACRVSGKPYLYFLYLRLLRKSYKIVDASLAVGLFDSGYLIISEAGKITLSVPVIYLRVAKRGAYCNRLVQGKGLYGVFLVKFVEKTVFVQIVEAAVVPCFAQVMGIGVVIHCSPCRSFFI